MPFTSADDVSREDAASSNKEAGKTLRKEIEDAIQARKFNQVFKVYGTFSNSLISTVKAELSDAGFNATIEQCGQGVRGSPWVEVTLRKKS